ncbi:MAG: ACP S-malonyltransferase [Planctomycetota bacterium]
MKQALLFPGQGAQYVGMGKNLIENFSVAATLFQNAEDLLKIPLTRYCLDGPEEKLSETQICQPAILVHSIAVWKVIQQETDAWKSQSVCGLSLGEYSALVVAGVLDFSAALELVRQRGQYMQEACDLVPSKMATIVGLTQEQLTKVVQQASQEKGLVQIANILAETQIAISGKGEPLDFACELAKSAGASKIFPLKVAGAFHSELMKPAQEKLNQAIQKTKMNPASIPVISNVSAKETSTVAQIQENLMQQLTCPVLWFQSMQYLLAQGYESFLELGPGSVLTGVLKRMNRTARRTNLEDAPSVKTWLEQLRTTR